MNWMRAMTIMLDGGTVTRNGWPPYRKIFIAKDASDISKPPPILPSDLVFPAFCLNDDPPNRTEFNWLPDQGDLFGTDWQIA